MAFFDYDSTYSQKDLYDWVLTVLAVAKQLNLTSLTTFLDNFRAFLTKKRGPGEAPLDPLVAIGRQHQKDQAAYGHVRPESIAHRGRGRWVKRNVRHNLCLHRPIREVSGMF